MAGTNFGFSGLVAITFLVMPQWSASAEGNRAGTTLGALRAEPQSEAAATVRVVLASGGFVRGKIVEHIEGERIVVEKPDGKRVALDWQDIERVEDLSDPPDGAALANNDVPDGKVRLRVNVVGDRPMAVHRFTGQSSTIAMGNGYATVVFHESVCNAPCDVLLDAKDPRRYFLKAPRVPASPKFFIHDRGPNIDLQVKPGVRGLSAAGFVALTVGLSTLIGGGTMLIVDHALGGPSSSGIRRAGLPLTIFGSVSTAISIPMLIFGRNRLVR